MPARIVTTLVVGVLFLSPAATAEIDPYLQPDETWISISGAVVSTDEDAFRLDYGGSTIVVEMDDWDRYGNAKGLLDGDRVTVYGRIDAGLFERTTIEASSVYVESLNTHFYANSADEEGDASAFWNVPVTSVVTASTNIRGTVTSTDPDDRTFTLNTGDLQLTVDTSRLGYNPLDEFGYQQIDEGDQVSVTGFLTTDFFTGREFEADAVITLTDASDS